MPNVYRYPYTMLSEQTDYLQIDIVGYTPVRDSNPISGKVKVPDKDAIGPFRKENPRPMIDKGIKSLTGRAGNRRNSNKKSEGTILLPIPSNISDTNAVSYESSSLNSIAGAAVGGVMAVMEGGQRFGNMSLTEALTATGDDVKSAISSVNSATGGMGEVRGFITRFLASKAVGIANINITPNQILARSTGQIMNPNMELLFNGPGLRSFRFQFKLTPRGETEANEIRNIIRTFKEHMAPKVDDAGPFLKTPDVFELRYRKGTDPHPFLHRFKQCFLREVSVNYTGEGTYATYDDGTPVSMIMDLSFQEIEPIYDIDYGTGSIANADLYSPTPGGVGY